MSPKPDKKRAEIFYRRGDAGPALDREIESRVASLLHRSPVPWSNPPSYTTDVDRARFLLDVAERREGAKTAVVETPSGWASSFDFGGADEDLIVGRGDTEALAICAAFMSKIRKQTAGKRLRGGLLDSAGRRFQRATRRVGRARFIRRIRKAVRNLLFP